MEGTGKRRERKKGTMRIRNERKRRNKSEKERERESIESFTPFGGFGVYGNEIFSHFPTNSLSLSSFLSFQHSPFLSIFIHTQIPPFPLLSLPLPLPECQSLHAFLQRFLFISRSRSLFSLSSPSTYLLTLYATKKLISGIS